MEAQTKKVLILAYDFPPYVSVGGLRPYNWFQYFKEYGYEPIVVTRQWSNQYGNELDYIAASENSEVVMEEMDAGTIIRTPYKPNLANRMLLKHGQQKWNLLRRSISAFYEFGQFFLPIGPKRKLYSAAKKYLADNQVCCILATGDPFILFHYADKLSRYYKTPWIADYRDPWTTNKTNFISQYIKPWNWFFERKIVKRADLVCTVDQVFKRQIQEIIGDKRIEILPNGYDPTALENVAHINQEKDTMCIAFVGTIYPWHPIETVLEGINSFYSRDNQRKIQVNFYGINNPMELTQCIETYFPQLAALVSITPRIANQELLPLLARNNIMLLFNYYAYTGTKIYDYIGIRRKILLCFSDEPAAELLKQKFYNIQESPLDNLSIQSDILEQTNSGITIRDKQHFLETLESCYSEFTTTGQIRCESIHTEQFSRKIQVAKLSKLLEEISTV